MWGLICCYFAKKWEAQSTRCIYYILYIIYYKLYIIYYILYIIYYKLNIIYQISYIKYYISYTIYINICYIYILYLDICMIWTEILESQTSLCFFSMLVKLWVHYEGALPFGILRSRIASSTQIDRRNIRIMTYKIKDQSSWPYLQHSQLLCIHIYVISSNRSNMSVNFTQHFFDTCWTWSLQEQLIRNLPPICFAKPIHRENPPWAMWCHERTFDKVAVWLGCRWENHTWSVLHHGNLRVPPFGGELPLDYTSPPNFELTLWVI